MTFIGWLAGWAFILYLVDKFLHRNDVPFAPLSESVDCSSFNDDNIDDEDYV